eukprot:Nitzschia sp. Nitz4//scaffold20_size174350//120273//121259//NITZ4_002118-RA/size174350-processed-gene-0.65-mRNA-1//1//CDS//3329541857//9139//frame0
MATEATTTATTSNTNNNNNNSNNNNQKNKNPTKKIATREEYGGDKEGFVYKSGIPTLRSSAHRVKFDVKRRKHDPKPKDRHGKETNTPWLPQPLLLEDVFDYNLQDYDIAGAIRQMLASCDESLVGTCPTDRLEDFQVPLPSVWRSVNGGCCETAQKYLSDQVASNEFFLQVFDRFVREQILPYYKRRLCEAEPSLASDPLTFYVQRPPTLRLQPGPGWAKVKPHNDAEYGHQHGELNFWVPLTDRELTQVDLWSETKYQDNDYHPIPAKVGQVISFHGSSCMHYVNHNPSEYTRVSLDFRIGVQGFFDPYWQMKGTTDDHGRCAVTI